jgi:hypothetical protein
LTTFGQKFEWEPLEHAAGSHGTRPSQIPIQVGLLVAEQTETATLWVVKSMFKSFHLMMLGIETLI